MCGRQSTSSESSSFTPDSCPNSPLNLGSFDASGEISPSDASQSRGSPDAGRARWNGVSLGGWLLLEPGPSYPFFNDVSPEDVRCEWDLMKILRRQKALGQLQRHRETHICFQDFLQIKAMGLNAVRLPIGYWVVLGPSHGDPYEGPCIEFIDRAVEWAERAGLEVLLDLHASPGGESAEAPCGRLQRPANKWHWQSWRMEESLQALEVLAARYKDSEHVTGIEVCNEPSNAIPSEELCRFYDKAVDTIRRAGMAASKVAVVLPVFQRSVSEFADAWDTVSSGRHENICFDVHYYHCFGEDWQCRTLAQHLRAVQVNAEELQKYPCVVGEWSLALGQAALAGKSLSRKEVLAIFAQTQRSGYEHASHGWFFWTWKDGNGVEWDLRSCYQQGLLSGSPCALPTWSGNGEDPLEEQLDPSPADPHVRYGDTVCLRAFHGGWMQVKGRHVAAQKTSRVGRVQSLVICQANANEASNAVVRSGDVIQLRSHSGKLITVSSKGEVLARPSARPSKPSARPSAKPSKLFSSLGCEDFEVHTAPGHSAELHHRSTIFLKSRTYGVVVDADPKDDTLQARFRDFGHWQKFVVDLKLPTTVAKSNHRRLSPCQCSPSDEASMGTPGSTPGTPPRKRVSELPTPSKLCDVRRRLRYKTGPSIATGTLWPQLCCNPQEAE